MIHQEQVFSANSCQIALIVIVIALLIINLHLTKTIKQACINPDFGCYNKFGGQRLGAQFIKKEKRKLASGVLLLMVCDIGGMGLLNDLVGEAEVNNRIKKALENIRTWRGLYNFEAQINSGDEFAFFVDAVDAKGVGDRMNKLFQFHGFSGVYYATREVKSNNFFQEAQMAMEEVYVLKKMLKAKAKG